MTMQIALVMTILKLTSSTFRGKVRPRSSLYQTYNFSGLKQSKLLLINVMEKEKQDAVLNNVK